MSGWLVGHVPSWLMLFGLIVVIAGGAVLIQRYVRRRYPVLIEGEHNDVTKFTYGFIGFLYAFFIGFVVSSMWGQINAADTNARAEGAVAVQMVTHATFFDKTDSDRIRQSLLTYERAAIAEWSSIGDARSPDADNALAGLYTTYQQVQATTDVQKTFLATSYSNLDTISQARTERLLTAREDTAPMAALGGHLPDERDGHRDRDHLRRREAGHALPDGGRRQRHRRDQPVPHPAIGSPLHRRHLDVV